jgi:hypothetical protein
MAVVMKQGTSDGVAAAASNASATPCTHKTREAARRWGVGMPRG